MMARDPGRPGTRVSNALGWTSLLRVFTRALAVGTTLVLAHLIPPEEYGVFATVLIAYQGLGAFTDLSAGASLVQMRQDPKPYIDTAWTVDVVRGLALGIALFLLAPVWTNAFHVPEATPLLRTLAAVPVITGFHSVGPTILRRELRFDRVFVLHATEASVYSIVAVGAGYIRHDAWALVAGVVASFTARVAASYLISPIRARLHFDLMKFREMFRFSKWTNAYVMTDFVLETADNIIVAGLLGPTALAFYRMGYQLATEGSSALQWVVTSVAFPAFAMIQLDQAHVRAGFRRLFAGVAVVLLPLTLALIVLGPLAVPVLLGDRWASAVVPLQIIAIAALARGIIETARPVLLGLGRSRDDFGLKVLQSVLLVAFALVGGLLFGMLGVAWAVVAAAVATMPLWWYLLRRTAQVGLIDVIGPAAAPVIAALGTLATLLLLPRAQVDWMGLASGSFALTAAYCSLTILLDRLLPHSGLAAARRTKA